MILKQFEVYQSIFYIDICLSRSMLIYPGLSHSISGYPWQSWAASAYLRLLWLCPAISVYHGLFLAISSYFVLLGLYLAILGYLELSRAIQAYLGLSWAILGHLLLSLARCCKLLTDRHDRVIEELTLLKMQNWYTLPEIFSKTIRSNIGAHQGPLKDQGWSGTLWG